MKRKKLTKLLSKAICITEIHGLDHVEKYFALLFFLRAQFSVNVFANLGLGESGLFGKVIESLKCVSEYSVSQYMS